MVHNARARRVFVQGHAVIVEGKGGRQNDLNLAVAAMGNAPNAVAAGLSRNRGAAGSPRLSRGA